MKEQQYERLYYQKSRNPTMKVPMELIIEVQYLVNRAHFINPTHLPAITESFLAKDFNYAEYLAMKLSQASQQIIKNNFLSLLIGLPIIAITVLFTASKSFEVHIWYTDLVFKSCYLMNFALFFSIIRTVVLFWYI